jgi:hypothetical protein
LQWRWHGSLLSKNKDSKHVNNQNESFAFKKQQTLADKKYNSSMFLTFETPIQTNGDTAKKTCDKHMNRAKVRQEKDSKARCNRC